MSKVVLITGGSSGIGKSIGEFLHQKGFVVYGTSRNPEKITNSIFPLVALDVRDKQSIVNCVAEVIQKSGRLDIVTRPYWASYPLSSNAFSTTFDIQSNNLFISIILSD